MTSTSTYGVQALGFHELAQRSKALLGALSKAAMVAVKLEHSAQHQASIFKRLQSFRKEGLLCDVVVKSRGGAEHQAHTAVLCAASKDFQNMLVGPFREATQVQHAQPVELAASDAVVFALLEYIYGDQPEVELEDCSELLRLADAYNLPELAAAIEASLHSAPVATALKVLQQTQGLHNLKAACEQKVAANFEACIDMIDFLELNDDQLGRILRREDLQVSREEVVVKALLNWFNESKDRGIYLALLLQNVDFQSLSSTNLARLGQLSASMGPIGHHLQRDVEEALRAHKKRSASEASEAFRPKRRCLQHWSADVGASVQGPQKVLGLPSVNSICWHDGAIYCAAFRGVFRWKPGDTESQAVAGIDASVNGVNDLGVDLGVSVSPESNMCVVDVQNRRVLSFRNGSGNTVLSGVDVMSVSCSPNGAVYLLTQQGAAVEKLVGAKLHPVIFSKDLPAELRFGSSGLFATKDEVIYISDNLNDRVLRIKPGETKPVVVGEAPNKESSDLQGLFVTEEEKIYVADIGQQKVWAFHAGDAAWTQVLECPGGLEVEPWDVLVEGGSLYVNMVGVVDDSDAEDGGAAFDPEISGIYEYLLSPELQLE